MENDRESACDQEYEASLPEGVRPQKWDVTADAALVISNYLAAVPFYRTSGLQAMCEIPLPESTQFERCSEVAKSLEPIYETKLKRLLPDFIPN